MRETPEYNKFILQTSIQTDFCTWSRKSCGCRSQLCAFWAKQLIAHFLLKGRAPPRSLPETMVLPLKTTLEEEGEMFQSKQGEGADEQCCCYQSLCGLIFKNIRLKGERRLKQLDWGRREIQRFNNGNILEKRPEDFGIIYKCIFQVFCGKKHALILLV